MDTEKLRAGSMTTFRYANPGTISALCPDGTSIRVYPALDSDLANWIVDVEGRPLAHLDTKQQARDYAERVARRHGAASVSFDDYAGQYMWIRVWGHPLSTKLGVENPDFNWAAV